MTEYTHILVAKDGTERPFKTDAFCPHIIIPDMNAWTRTTYDMVPGRVIRDVSGEVTGTYFREAGTEKMSAEPWDGVGYLFDRCDAGEKAAEILNGCTHRCKCVRRALEALDR